MNKKPHVLIAEDDPDDAYFIRSAFEESNVFSRIDLVANGQELLKYLSDSSNPVPDLIITDLNMPKMDGYEVISRLKENKNTLNIPVIVLSTSDSEESKLRCQELGAADYLVKPFDIEEFNRLPYKIIKEMTDYE